jgi:hypothetical protein
VPAHAACWRSGWFGCVCRKGSKYPTILEEVACTIRQSNAVMQLHSPRKSLTIHDPIPARLAALKTTPTPDLKKQWRDLFDSETPPFNRRCPGSRLS